MRKSVLYRRLSGLLCDSSGIWLAPFVRHLVSLFVRDLVSHIHLSSVRPFCQSSVRSIVWYLPSLCFPLEA